jgi:hypothetical protein
MFLPELTDSVEIPSDIVIQIPLRTAPENFGWSCKTEAQVIQYPGFLNKIGTLRKGCVYRPGIPLYRSGEGSD